MEAGTWYALPGKASSEDFKNPRKRLVDLVRMFIAAHRVNRWDIVCSCWQLDRTGVEIGDLRRVSSGTMLAALNLRGADAVAQQIVRDASNPKGPTQPWHFDCDLLNWLLDEATNVANRACYISPPVGNYTTRQSRRNENNVRKHCRSAQLLAGVRALPWHHGGGGPADVGPKVHAVERERGYIDVGGPIIDDATAGKIEWLSFWRGSGRPP